jgi:hypothetical protein
MKIGNVIEGLQILAKYETKGLGAYINGAEHDILYAVTADVVENECDLDEYGEPVIIDSRITMEDMCRLKDIGWFIDRDSKAWSSYI